MKPFDLQKALAGEPVVTRDGKGVTIFNIKSAHPTHPVIDERIGIVEHFALRWTKEGKYSTGSNDCGLDLFMAPVKRQEWVNIYLSRDAECGKYRVGTDVFPSEGDAELIGRVAPENNFVKSVLIREWEE